MAVLQVEFVAANGKIWEGEARQVSARGVEGSFGVLPGHLPMLTVLTEGELRIEGVDESKVVQLEDGFLSVDRDHVTIVTDSVKQS